ncbi:metallophosphoesterase domain-containing protein 1-like [Symsagittifera roscoffensis]|uniref:metallophosphoesterase domain-containing protein 1-like n=1 Tax=Symsagittifera roscoffensis TaxID=84072 RepID=UPI00307C3B13
MKGIDILLLLRVIAKRNNRVKMINFSSCNPESTITSWARVNRKVGLENKSRQDLLLPELEERDKIRFVCLSDTHNKHTDVVLPEGDVLIHTGDFCMRGVIDEAEEFNRWLGTLPFEHKVVIAGNHDMCLDTRMKRGRKIVDGHELFTNCYYLQEESVEIEGYKIFGSPWVPTFGFWGFMENRSEIKQYWDKIPSDTDILLTHGPPMGVLDKCESGALAGCMHLLDAVVNRVKPKYHVFGHIHEDRGIAHAAFSETTFINAANCTIFYQAENEPIVFELPRKH